jgi:hypothetical protein
VAQNGRTTVAPEARAAAMIVQFSGIPPHL